MPSSAIPGFIKKRTASQRYDRSPRQLTRDITFAIEMSDDNVLPNLKIRTEDGEVIDGVDATVDLIKSLRSAGRNPMWYLGTSWLEETYGKRDKQGATQAERDAPELDPTISVGDRPNAAATLTEMMQQTIHELKEDKRLLESQLKIKDGQIEKYMDRWQESNVLTKQLHELIGRLEQLDQNQLGSETHETTDASEKVIDIDANQVHSDDRAESTVHVSPSKRKQPSTKPRTSAPASRRKNPKQKSGTKKAQAKSRSTKPDKKRVSRFEEHTPTFHKALSNLLRRQ